LEALASTDVPGFAICNAFVPLKRSLTANDILEIHALADQIGQSSDPDLSAIGMTYKKRLC
jgi:hypothetical protein